MKDFIKKVRLKTGEEIRKVHNWDIPLISMARHIIKKTGYLFGFEIRRIQDSKMWTTVSLKTKDPSKGNVLLSYRTSPFLADGETEMRQHTAAWECTQIARTFLDRRYDVDIIYWLDNVFLPKKDYSFFIDVHSNMERISPLLNKDCVKIFHAIWAHWLFHNYAALKRHLDLERRRGIVIRPMRQLEPTRGIEEANYATILGNSFTASTYEYAKKPMFLIPISTQTVYPWPDKKDFNACRKHFLWFGGTGLVHKGLDLVLEAFAEMPDYNLTVCGRITYEKDFMRYYHKELFEMPNIHVEGWVDVTSPTFKKIADQCIGLIHPSCSEGQSGAVVNCLHAALIPIVSYESGVDVDSFGIVLKDCSIDEIKKSVHYVSDLPSQQLRLMARQAWEFARSNHTRERFAEQYSKAVDKIIGSI